MNKKFKPIAMWLMPSLLYAWQYPLRICPGLMMQDIMQKFALDAAGFGILASVYYYGYSLMQIPVALAIERFGARIVISLCTILMGLATLLFVHTQSWPMALVARCLIGVGSASIWLGGSKVSSEWFSKKNYTYMISLTFSIGLIGAVFGGQPLSMLMQKFGGDPVFTAIGIISIILGLIVFSFLRSPPHHTNSQTSERLRLSDIKTVFFSRDIWFLGFANLLMVGVLEGFADVWGVNYLMTSADFVKNSAAQLVSYIFIGVIFGGPLLAWISHKYGLYRTISGCGLGMALGMFALTAVGIDQGYFLASLFFLFGILSCYQVLIFSAGSKLVDAKSLGITIAILNCLNMLGGSFFHTVIGYVMDLFWAGCIVNGVRQYDVLAYQYGLSIIPISSLIGVVLVMMVSKRSKTPS